MSDTEQTPAVMGDLDDSLLIPSTWETPKEEIPVKVVMFRKRWSSPEYNAPNKFRTVPLPMRKHQLADGTVVEHNSIQQFDIRLQRLDAIYVHEDGSPFTLPDGSTAPTAPVIMYATIDLEKFDQKNGVVKPLQKTTGKEQYQIKAWTEKLGQLVPNSERFEGMNLVITRYRELEISKGFPATNIIVPKEILPPTYTFTGEVLRFKAQAQGVNDAAVASAADAGLVAVSAGLSKEEAAAKIGEFLKAKGITEPDGDVLALPDFPAAARIEPFVTALALGSGKETLAGFGVTI